MTRKRTATIYWSQAWQEDDLTLKRQIMRRVRRRPAIRSRFDDDLAIGESWSARASTIPAADLVVVLFGPAYASQLAATDNGVGTECTKIRSSLKSGALRPEQLIVALLPGATREDLPFWLADRRLLDVRGGCSPHHVQEIASVARRNAPGVRDQVATVTPRDRTLATLESAADRIGTTLGSATLVATVGLSAVLAFGAWFVVPRTNLFADDGTTGTSAHAAAPRADAILDRIPAGDRPAVLAAVAAVRHAPTIIDRRRAEKSARALIGQIRDRGRELKFHVGSLRRLDDANFATSTHLDAITPLLPDGVRSTWQRLVDSARHTLAAAGSRRHGDVTPRARIAALRAFADAQLDAHADVAGLRELLTELPDELTVSVDAHRDQVGAAERWLRSWLDGCAPSEPLPPGARPRRDVPGPAESGRYASPMP